MKLIIRLAIFLLFLLVFIPTACINLVNHDIGDHHTQASSSSATHKIQKSIQIGDATSSNQFAFCDALSRDHGYSYYRSRG